MDNPENNMRLFLKRLRARLRPLDPAARFPIEEGWQQLKTRIDAAENGEDTVQELHEERRRRTWVFPMKLGYAAAVVLILLTGGIYWFQHSRRAQGQANPMDGVAHGKPGKGEKAILPPSRGIQLTLSDGRKIPIGQRQTLTEQGGVAIRTDSGKVEYQVDQGPTPDATPGELAYNTLDVPRGNKARITLPDGTRVWINAASRMKYPTAFRGALREVQLDGEAYFEINPDAEHPFIVHAGKMDIKVLGTAFNVNTFEPTFFTTLVQGKVSVKGKADEMILSPGEQAALNTASGDVRKMSVNTADFTGWKDDHLFIGNCSFEKIVELLGREFDYDILLADPSLKQYHFTIDLPAPKNLQEVLEHICNTREGIQFSITGRIVIISRTEGH